MTLDKDNISYEESLSLLENKIKKLQGGNLSLDEALKTFQEAVEISRICNNKLDMAQETVKRIVPDANGDDYELEEF